MMWTANFIGHRIGALGGLQRIGVEVEASTSEQARLKLYDRFEQIDQLTLHRHPNGIYSGPPRTEGRL